jgi:hypothetical protein
MHQRLITTAALLFAAAFTAALSGCGSIKQDLNPPPPTPEQQAQKMEPMLSAAGFTMLPANTPESQTKLSSLLPLQVQYYIGKKGRLHYYMADPYYCRCMYIGSEEAYQKYEQIKLNQNFADQEGEISRENLEAQQMEDMDLQEEMFNPYGMSLAGPMGPAIYW